MPFRNNQTVTAVPQARADATVAKWTFRKLNHDLTLLSNFMLKDSESRLLGLDDGERRMTNLLPYGGERFRRYGINYIMPR